MPDAPQKRFSGAIRQPGVSIGAARMLQARTFILANPHLTKSQIIIETGLSDSTIARARRDLIAEGRLIEPRNAPIRQPEPKPAKVAKIETGPAEGIPTKKSSGPGMLDHTAMIELASMVDKVVESGDEEYIQRLLIKQCLTFALRTDLHPDTRMSASQMWGKLRDMSRAKDLGPGKPKTRADAVARTRDILLAVGPEITLEAVHLAFTVPEAPDAQAQAEQAVPVGGPPQDAGAARLAGDTTPADDLRPIDVGTGNEPGGSAGQQDHDLLGPSEGREGQVGDPRTPPHPNAGSPWD